MKSYSATVTKVEELTGLPGVYQINLHVKQIADDYSTVIPTIQLHVGKAAAKEYMRLHMEDQPFTIQLPV